VLRRLRDLLHRDLPAVSAPGAPDATAIVLPVLASFAFIVSHYDGNTDTWRSHLASLWKAPQAIEPIVDHLYWYGASLVLFLAIPLLALKLLKEPLGEYGLGLGRWKLGLGGTALLLAVMLPIVLVAARTPAFAGQYPLTDGATKSWPLFWMYEAAYAAYFVSWEYVFRSFLLFGLYRRIGLHAIYFQMMPFALLHFGKPQAETMGSIFAGIALGYLALRTRSFWWGAFVHIAVAFTMDIAASWARLHGVH
jgi:hypothetical protein